MQQIAPSSAAPTPLEPQRFLSISAPLSPEQQSLFLEVSGYLDLHLPSPATDLLGGVDHAILDHPDLEALRLLSLEVGGIPPQQLAALAQRSLAVFPDQFRIFEMALIHSTTAERYTDVMELYERYQDHEWWGGNLMQNVADAAARLGRFKLALHFVEWSASRQRTPSAVMADPQLLPLWSHYAATLPDEEEAELLGSSALQRAHDFLARGVLDDGLCGFTLQHLVPKKLKPWCEPSRNALYYLRSDAPIKIKRQHHAWLDELRRRTLRLVRRAFRNGCIVRRGSIRALSPPAVIEAGETVLG